MKKTIGIDFGDFEVTITIEGDEEQVEEVHGLLESGLIRGFGVQVVGELGKKFGKVVSDMDPDRAGDAGYGVDVGDAEE